MLCAIKNSKIVITDSGGVQREAFFMKNSQLLLEKKLNGQKLLNKDTPFLSKPSNIQFLYEQVQDKLKFQIMYCLEMERPHKKLQILFKNYI